MADNDEVRNHLDAYDRMLKIFQMNNDNYFKRTQIVMIVIQSALFVAFTKLAWNPKLAFEPNNENEWLLLISLGIIPFIGILSAWIWFRLITKQGDYLEFCRCSLRNIEYCLANLGIPLEYFKNESEVFYSGKPHDFKWSGERFPHEEDHREGRGLFRHKVKGRLINIEKAIAISLVILWGGCLFAVGYLKTADSIHSAPKEAKMSSEEIIAVAAAAQAFFALCLLVVIGFQTKIMKGQKELSRKIDESNKVTRMQDQYTALSDSRYSFWESLRALYSYFKDYARQLGQKPPESLCSLINRYGLPDFDPTEVEAGDLRPFVQRHQEHWNQLMIWDFAKLVHNIPLDTEEAEGPHRRAARGEVQSQALGFANALRKAQRDLAYFWHFWNIRLANLDICEHLDPNSKELAMLTWLEFVLALTIEGSEEPGKTGLFQLAKDVWKSDAGSSDRSNNNA